MFSELILALSTIEKEKAIEEVGRLLKEKVNPFQIIEKGIMLGMNIVGQKFEEGDYFLPELLLAADIVEACTDLIKPYITSDQYESKGIIVIGTISGDMHDLGKNLVIRTLESAGFKVIDLGVDVPTEKFISAAKEEKADIVAISTLLTTTMVHMKDVITGLRADSDLKDVKVLVGGSPLDDEYAAKMGADAYGENVVDALRKAQERIS